MQEIILKSSFPTKRTRLTREELLAGKCFPDSDHPSDPRLRSPDEILRERSPKQPAAVEQPSLVSQTDVKEEAPELDALKKQYEREISAWRDYEKKVHEWKQQVMGIVENSARAAQERDFLADEVERLKKSIEQRDQELRWMREQLTLPPSPTTSLTL